VLSESLTYSISTAKARLQVQRVAKGETAAYRSTFQTLSAIVRTEGWRKLYSGFGSVLVCSAPARGAYFAGYEAVKSLGGTHLSAQHQPLVHFMAGSIAQLSGSVLWVPQDVVKERLQVQKDPLSSNGMVKGNFKGSLDAVKRIIQEEGIRGLYRGYIAHQVVWTPYNGLYFGAYEQIKSQWIAAGLPHQRHIKSDTGAVTSILPQWGYPLCAAGAGAVAAAITAPMDVVKTRLQTQGSSGTYRGGWHCVTQIWQHEGPISLFRGVGARILFLSPNHAISMSIYEYMQSLWRSQSSADKPTSKLRV